MRSEIQRYFQNGNIITRLLLVNVAVFVIQSILLLFFTLAGAQSAFLNGMAYLYFPAGIREFLQQPWTILSYQFLHEPLSIFHILFNMLYLYWFGRILIDFLKPAYVLPLYITGGISGALLFMVIYQISPAFQTHAYLLGASASILALVTAAATLVPDYTVHLILIGPVRLKWIALIAVLIDVVGISAGGNAGGHIAHLGGAATGFLFIRSYRMGMNWLAWTEKIKLPAFRQRRNKPRVVYVKPDLKKSNTPEKPQRPDQQRLDDILDKISRSGYDSLSASEKAFLFNMSKDK